MSELPFAETTLPVGSYFIEVKDMGGHWVVRLFEWPLALLVEGRTTDDVEATVREMAGEAAWLSLHRSNEWFARFKVEA